MVELSFANIEELATDSVTPPETDSVTPPVDTMATTDPDGETTTPEEDSTDDEETTDPDGGNDGPPSSGAGKDEEECGNSGGYWNMALVCADAGVSTVTCSVSGQISLFGIVISGNYSQGKPYQLGWERWSCQNSSGNCCDSGSQGLIIK